MLTKKTSKLLISALLTLVIINQSMASGLENGMKQMASSIKLIKSTITNPSMNSKNAELADKFVASVTNAKKYLPGGLSRLPEPEKSERIALYQEMMDHAIELGSFLGDALRKNDQEKAQKFLAQIKVIESDGHKEFKGNDLTAKNLENSNLLSAGASDLKSGMKTMGIKLKLIVSQVKDSDSAKTNAQLADDFVVISKEVKNFIPSAISQLPVAQQQEKINLYNQLMDKNIELGNKLSAALHNGDFALYQSILKDLAQNKKDGHYEFNN